MEADESACLRHDMHQMQKLSPRPRAASLTSPLCRNTSPDRAGTHQTNRVRMVSSTVRVTAPSSSVTYMPEHPQHSQRSGNPARRKCVQCVELAGSLIHTEILRALALEIARGREDEERINFRVDNPVLLHETHATSLDKLTRRLMIFGWGVQYVFACLMCRGGGGGGGGPAAAAVWRRMGTCAVVQQVDSHGCQRDPQQRLHMEGCSGRASIFFQPHSSSSSISRKIETVQSILISTVA